MKTLEIATFILCVLVFIAFGYVAGRMKVGANLFLFDSTDCQGALFISDVLNEGDRARVITNSGEEHYFKLTRVWMEEKPGKLFIVPDK